MFPSVLVIFRDRSRSQILPGIMEAMGLSMKVSGPERLGVKSRLLFYLHILVESDKEQVAVKTLHIRDRSPEELAKVEKVVALNPTDR